MVRRLRRLLMNSARLVRVLAASSSVIAACSAAESTPDSKTSTSSSDNSLSTSSSHSDGTTQGDSTSSLGQIGLPDRPLEAICRLANAKQQVDGYEVETAPIMHAKQAAGAVAIVGSSKSWPPTCP